MSITKQGIITSPNIYESSAMNLHYGSNLGDRDSSVYTFTPSTEINSCMRDIIVHGELYPANELMHARFKVKWNGFDTSNTSGNFNIFFQGYYTKSDGNTTWWTPLSDSADSHRNLKNLVLSSSSGEYIYDFIFNNEPRRTHEGIRSDYSNGTGTISFSDFIVIPEKYYVPSTPQSGNSVSLHIGKDYISAGEIYEI